MAIRRALKAWMVERLLRRPRPLRPLERHWFEEKRRAIVRWWRARGG